MLALSLLCPRPVEVVVPPGPVIVQAPLVSKSVHVKLSITLGWIFNLLTVMGMLLSGDTPPLMKTSCPELVCFSTKITVRFFSPGCGGCVVVSSPPPCVVDVVGPGVGPGPVPSHPTQMAKIPSNIYTLFFFHPIPFLGPIGPLVVALSVCMYVCMSVTLLNSTLTQLNSDSTQL